ncbi:MAG: hypothetical protein N2249_05575 [Melioribacter sp.]|nr:hypothetical protein [Melioribacter sp.]
MVEVSSIGLILFFCYPLLLVATAVYFSITKEMNVERYYYADKNTNWLILGLSFVTSTFLSPYLLGVTYKGFIIVVPLIYATISVIIIYFYNKILLPNFIKEGLLTIPEYFEKKYSRACRYFISVLYVLENFGIRLLLTIALGNFLISSFTNLDAYFSLLFFLLITSVYLIIGGIKAEVYISAAQLIFIIVVIIGIMYWFLFHNVFDIKVTLHKLSLIKYTFSSVIDFVEVIVGLSIVGFWFICGDQINFQKSLCTKNLIQAKKSYKALSIYQIVPLLIFTIPAIVIFNYDKNDFQLESIKKILSSIQIPGFLKHGIFISVFFALVSNFSNYFYSTVNIITNEFYRFIRPKATDRELVLAGRITLIFLLFISILLISLAQSFTPVLFIKLFYLLLYLAALLSALMLSSLLINILRAESALVTLSLSIILVIVKFIYNLPFEANSFNNNLIEFYAHLNFLQYSILIFVFAFGVHVFLSGVINFLTKEKYEQKKITKLVKEDVNKKLFLAFPFCFAILGLLKTL